MIVRVAAWAALMLLATLPVAMAAVQGMLKGEAVVRSYESFHQTEGALEASRPVNFRQALADSYATYIAGHQKPATLRVLPASSANLLFRAAYDTAFYTFDRRYVEDMEADLARMRALEADESRHYQDLYEALIRTRDLSTAKSVLATRPELSDKAAPAIEGALIEGAGPSALVLSEDGSSVSQQPIVLGNAIDIVVIGHPSCHFSSDAVAAIEANLSLRAVFTRHARWLMPQDGNMRPRRIAEWNAAHPAARMSYIYRQADWPAIDYWGTPTFYFFRNGKRVGKLVGWPPNGEGETALRKELERLGLL